MAKEQKALMVHVPMAVLEQRDVGGLFTQPVRAELKNVLSELNRMLAQGWTLVSMEGAKEHFLVIVEKETP